MAGNSSPFETKAGQGRAAGLSYQRKKHLLFTHQSLMQSSPPRLLHIALLHQPFTLILQARLSHLRGF